MIASTCLRLRPVRRAIGFATDLATRPRIPVRDPLPISTALSSTLMIESFPNHAPFKRAARPADRGGGAGFPALISHHRAGAPSRFAANAKPNTAPTRTPTDANPATQSYPRTRCRTEALLGCEPLPRHATEEPADQPPRGAIEAQPVRNLIAATIAITTPARAASSETSNSSMSSGSHERLRPARTIADPVPVSKFGERLRGAYQFDRLGDRPNQTSVLLRDAMQAYGVARSALTPHDEHVTTVEL